MIHVAVMVIRILLQFHTYRRQWRRFWVIITRFGYILFVLYGLISWFRPRPAGMRIQRRETLLYCLFAVITGSVLSRLIGAVWRRPRPFMNGKKAWCAHKDNASFPSNHTMNSVAISCIFLARGETAGMPLLIWSGVLAVSRVICRLHYVSDIIGGAFLGAGISHVLYHNKKIKKIIRYLLDRYEERIQVFFKDRSDYR